MNSQDITVSLEELIEFGHAELQIAKSHVRHQVLRIGFYNLTADAKERSYLNHLVAKVEDALQRLDRLPKSSFTINLGDL